MSLTKAQRDALPAEQFAVPAKRKLLINDERHTMLAWSNVDNTIGLSPAEKTAARHAIMARAEELELDTSDWSRLASVRLEAMSLAMPTDDGSHPNRMPFSGILTRIGKPSDSAPQGSGGRLIVLTQAAVETALKTLLGMGIDFTPSFDGHDAQQKVGIITDATIVDDAIHIEGIIYANDFPSVARTIRNMKSLLGFSFEATNVVVADPSADILVVESCVFTGAAILRKDKAAYTTTSLAATADQGKELDMTLEELQAAMKPLLAAAVEPLTKKIADIEAAQGEVAKTMTASKEMQKKVKPFAETLHSCADSMHAAGIGTDTNRGHATMVRKIADHMEASAAMGETPHVYREGYPYVASADKPEDKTAKVEASAEVTALNDKIAAQATQLADLTAKVAAAGTTAEAKPERKTLSPALTALLAKSGVEAPTDGKFTPELVNKVMATAGKDLTPIQKIEIKRAFERAEQGIAA